MRRWNATASRAMQQRQAKDTNEEDGRRKERRDELHWLLANELHCELGRERIVRVIRAHSSSFQALPFEGV